MSQYFQRIRESVSSLVSGTNRSAKRSATDNDTDHHTLATPARKRRYTRSKEGFPANADDGTEEFRQAFKGAHWYSRGEADQIRTNVPSRTSLHLCLGVGGERLSDNAARLLGRYITTNDHMTHLYINGLDAVDALFEGLVGQTFTGEVGHHPEAFRAVNAVTSAVSEEYTETK